MGGVDAFGSWTCCYKSHKRKHQMRVTMCIGKYANTEADDFTRTVQTLTPCNSSPLPL